MTEAKIRQSVVDVAARYLGLKEGDAKHLDILATWNAHKDPYARVYTMTVKDAWCMTFVWACFIKAGLADLVVTDCGCAESINRNNQYKQNWMENDAFVPSTGDVIMFDWDDTGSGDCKGWSEHTGIVVSCDGKTIKVIEGNSADTVRYTSYQVNGRYIRGFICPDFKSKADQPYIQEAGYAIAKNCASANVRKGPGTSFGIVAEVKGNEIFPYYAKADNGWLQISKDGKYGFVSPKYYKIMKTATIRGNDTWLRSTADTDTDGNKFFVLRQGEKVYLTGYSEQHKQIWYEVYAHGQKGLASGLYCKPD